MAMFLYQGRYSEDAIKAMVANPQDREAAARTLIEGIGGTLHSFHFTFGDYDFAAIVECDNTAMAAGAMAAAAGGAITGGSTTAMITTSEAEQAMAKAAVALESYSAPS